jgi:PAS domain S-box-containing protein
MKNKSDNPQRDKLRLQAEAKLCDRKKNAAVLPALQSDPQRLVHELEVHQIELEMQNEELAQSRAQVEAGLREYTDLYDFAPVGYFTLARDGEVHRVNLAGANLLGAERDALIKRRFGVFVSVESRPVFNAFIEKVFASDRKEACEVQLQKEWPAPSWVHIEAMREQGRREACRAMVSDITERKRLENKLRHYNEQLEQKTRDLEQHIFVTSHNLRSPLVNVQGFGRELAKSIVDLMEAIRGGDLSDEAKRKIAPIIKKDIPEALEFIQSGINQMDLQLSALLKLSRLGREAITIERLDMNKLVADIVKSFEYMVKETGAHITMAKLPPCMADATPTNQIFLNLIGNALKYLDAKRPGVIHIRGNRQESEIIYCVEDNGIGIAQEYQEKIFEIFYRVERGKYPSEGLGLTIVRQCAEKQGGAAWVESEPGKGSRFFLKLPSA